MVRSVPRASAGFSRLAASPVPGCAAGADQRVGLVDEQDDRLGRRLDLVDDLPQPLLELALHAGAGLQQADVERAQRRRPSAAAARRRAAMRSAKPSTTAVLPTPASPVRIGLFCRRRIRMSTIWRISSSRPTIGSISPLRAFSVRSMANLLERLLLAHLRRRHGAARLSRAPPAIEPSLAAEPVFGRAADDPCEILRQRVGA